MIDNPESPVSYESNGEQGVGGNGGQRPSFASLCESYAAVPPHLTFARNMRILLTLLTFLVGLDFSLGADTNEAKDVIGFEINMSVGIYGGTSCYFGSDGSVVYQRVIPNREAGHGMTEKRYVMIDSLAMDWSALTTKFNLVKVLNTKRKSDVGVAGESSLTLTVYFSDGTTKARWAFTNDPITEVWMEMTDRARDKTDNHIPLLIPYHEENFGRLQRYRKQGEDGTGQPATRPESKSKGGDKPQPESEGRSR